MRTLLFAAFERMNYTKVADVIIAHSVPPTGEAVHFHTFAL